MKTITYLFFALLLLIGKTDIKAQAVYGGIVPNYSQLILSNLSTGGGCSGGTPDIYFNLDGDTLDEIKVYSTGSCQISNIGLKHFFHSYLASEDTSIEFLWFSQFIGYCENRPMIIAKNYNAVIPTLGNWKHDTFSIYHDVYSLSCVGGYVLGNNYIPFRKKYAANFYLYGWMHVSSVPNAFYTQFYSYTKLPNHASGIYDTIACNSSYTFVNGYTLNNILHDTTYISTFVHPITGLDSLVLTYLHVNTYQNTYYDTICAGSTFTFADGSSAVLISDTIKQNNFTSTNGCDSIIYNQVEVKPVSTTNLFHSSCINQLPYVWQGQILNVPGNYYFQTTNSLGCDSFVTLHFNVSSNSSSSLSTVICSSQLPYVWNGQSLVSSGNYTYQTNNMYGCDSTVYLNLTVINSTSAQENITICSNQIPYTWNGQTINSAGTYTFQTTNAEGCDSLATIILAVLETSATAENITICSNQLPYIWNGQSIINAGTYTFQTTNVFGCDSLISLNLTVNDTSLTAENITICSNQLPYIWNGQIIINAGTYTFQTTNVFGCDSLISLNLTVNDTSLTTENITICSNQLPFTWNGQNLNSAGTYTFQTSNISGCDSVVFLNLTVNNTSDTTENITICSNQLPYIWNGQTIINAGTFTFQTTNIFGCDSMTTLNLSVNDTSFSVENISVCSNQLPFSWNGQNYSSAGSYTFISPNVYGCDSVVTLVLTIDSIFLVNTNLTVCSTQLPLSWNGQNLSSAGTYTFQTTNINGCDSSVILNLQVSNVDTTVLITSNILSANATNASYQWLSCYPYLVINNATSQSYMATVNGMYAVIIAQNGCIDTSSCFAITNSNFNTIAFLNKAEIYPNPASNLLFFRYMENKRKELYNGLGQLVLYSNSNTMDISKLPKGIYYLKCEGQCKKVIIE